MAFTLKVSKSLDSYITQVPTRQERVLDEAAIIVEKNQFRRLLTLVKNWTGNLGNSINTVSSKRERRVGPNQSIAPYAGKIEDGYPYDTAFTGYHYVRDSLRGVQLKFNNLIRRSLERP